MRSTVVPIDPSFPIIQENKLPVDFFRLWILQVTEGGLLIGSGSPETVIEAQQGKCYMDEDGSTGNVFYIKQKADIAGDRTQGWKLIG